MVENQQLNYMIFGQYGAFGIKHLWPNTKTKYFQNPNYHNDN